MMQRSAQERMQRARAAQIAWSSALLPQRARILERLRRRIASECDRIVETIVADTGKPALDALGGDLLATLEQMLYYERNAAHILAPKHVAASRLFFSRTRFLEYFEPHGVALVFGAANYPFQLSLVPAITALYAGNAVILKVSERTESVAHMIEELTHSANLPSDLLQVVCEPPEQAADYIDADPNFVFFTGSSQNGRNVAARAAMRGIPAILELGGSDPAIVFADCNLARTVEGVTYGAFSNAGQVCVGIKRLYIEQQIYDRFVSDLVCCAARLRVGIGHDCDLGVQLNGYARSQLRAQVDEALERGARLESSGSESLSLEAPVVLSHVPRDARLLCEECFGPILCVQPFSTEDEAIALANASPFALGASVWTRDSKRARRVALALSAGNCSTNDVIRNISNPGAAFGGNAASGYGRYHGAHGLRAFSRIKTVMENRSSRPREVNWFPLTRKTYNRLQALIELRHRPNGLFTALRRLVIPVVFASALALQCLVHGAQGAHLWLRVELPPGAHGSVAYLVFKSADGFPQNTAKAIVHGFSALSSASRFQSIDVGELPPGNYAVSVYLDENGNHKLDSGFFGIPKEPVGASNNPTHRMGPPRFDECSFPMGATTQTISIRLVTPK